MDVRVNLEFVEKDKFIVKFEGMDTKIFIDKRTDEITPVGPTPLELFLSSLAGCIGVYSKKYLERRKITFNFLKVFTEAKFYTENPPMLKEIKTKVITDAALAEKKDNFLRFIQNCPVHNTIIHTEGIEIEVSNS